MAKWTIHMFGIETALSFGGRPISLPDVGWSLLGCLLSSAQLGLSRSKLASELWPESSEEAARHCLATTLWRLKQKLPCFESMLDTRGDRIAVAAGSTIWVDTIAFERRAQAALADQRWLEDSARRTKLRRALDLYRGEFLIDHAPEMVMIERERLRALYLDASFQLAHVYAQFGEWRKTLETCRSICLVEPLREDAQRLLIEAYAACGNRALAIQQYQDLEQLLSDQLAVRPMRETSDVLERISGTQSTVALKGDGSNRELLIEARQQMLHTVCLIDKALHGMSS